MSGISTAMFAVLKIDEDAFRSVVAHAQSDEEVAAWVLKNTTAKRRDLWNAGVVVEKLPSFEESPDFFDRYPVARALAPESLLVEMLELDDRASFEGAAAP